MAIFPTSTDSIRVKIRILIVLAFSLGIPLAMPPRAFGSQVDAIKMKSGLLEKLDSIDVEKQIRKRKGRSLEDLEKCAASIKDSIAAVREAIEKRQDPAEASSTTHENDGSVRSTRAYQKYMPRNVFDWVVLVVGGIAIIAGIILCIGFFSMLFGKKGGEKTDGNASGPDHLSPELHGSSAGLESAIAALSSEVSKRRIDSLRDRMSGGNAEASTAGGAPPTAQPPRDGLAAGAEDIKSGILRAAREGASVNEISRRFHMGADQVSLILRVARKDGGLAQ